MGVYAEFMGVVNQTLESLEDDIFHYICFL